MRVEHSRQCSLSYPLFIYFLLLHRKCRLIAHYNINFYFSLWKRSIVMIENIQRNAKKSVNALVLVCTPCGTSQFRHMQWDRIQPSSCLSYRRNRHQRHTTCKCVAIGFYLICKQELDQKKSYRLRKVKLTILGSCLIRKFRRF